MNNEQLSPEEALERYAAEQEKAFREALGDELFEMLEEMSNNENTRARLLALKRCTLTPCPGVNLQGESEGLENGC